MDALIGACFKVSDVQIFRSSQTHFNQTISNKMTKGFEVIIKITKVAESRLTAVRVSSCSVNISQLNEALLVCPK